MDPVACLLRLHKAYMDRDRAEFEAAAEDYRNWRRGGGFAPDMSEHSQRCPEGDAFFYALTLFPWT